MSECIHYNANILRDQRVLYIKNWVHNGILYITHRFSSNGNLSFNEFRRQFPAVKVDFLQYEVIMRSIKKSKKIHALKWLTATKQLKVKFGLRCKRAIHLFSVLCILSASEAAPTALRKWDDRCNDHKWQNILTICFKGTPDVQLRWFQTRLLRRILTTNIYLFIQKMLIVLCVLFVAWKKKPFGICCGTVTHQRCFRMG